MSHLQRPLLACQRADQPDERNQRYHGEGRVRSHRIPSLLNEFARTANASVFPAERREFLPSFHRGRRRRVANPCDAILSLQGDQREGAGVESGASANTAGSMGALSR